MRTGDVCIRGDDGKIVKTVAITRESKQEPEADYSGFVGFLIGCIGKEKADKNGKDDYGKFGERENK